jgi:four helix bundle protein
MKCRSHILRAIYQGRFTNADLGVRYGRQIELQIRTKKFALRVIRLYRALPRCSESMVIGRQLLRWGTSVAANYRSACRARSRAEFLSKLGVVVEEADETVFWLELVAEAGLLQYRAVENLLDEANQLLAMFSAAQLTVKRTFRELERDS